MSVAGTLPLIISPHTLRGKGDAAARTPPGQTLTPDWPVLHFGPGPWIELSQWRLRVFGLCDHPYTLTLEELLALPRVELRCDIHCATGWSRLDNLFGGVQARAIIDLAQPRPEARFVMQHAASAPGEEWSANLPLDDFARDDCLLAVEHDGRPLAPEHGGPVRAVIPHLYFWKSAKWITGVELLAEDAPGFWEQRGHHMRGDPWREERHGRK